MASHVWPGHILQRMEKASLGPKGLQSETSCEARSNCSDVQIPVVSLKPQLVTHYRAETGPCSSCSFLLAPKRVLPLLSLPASSLYPHPDHSYFPSPAHFCSLESGPLAFSLACLSLHLYCASVDSPLHPKALLLPPGFQKI